MKEKPTRKFTKRSTGKTENTVSEKPKRRPVPEKAPSVAGQPKKGWVYAVSVIPGLEKLVQRDLAERLKHYGPGPILPGGERNSMVVYSTSTRPDPASLPLVEDLFRVVVGFTDVPQGPEGLALVEEAVDAPELWNDALCEWRNLHHVHQRAKLAFRIVSRADASGQFSRHALKRHVAKVFKKFSKPQWIAVEENADVEVWLHLNEGRLAAMLRLSDSATRHRKYKTQHIPGSLRPTLAAAMVMLSDPKPSDRFVDPMCGAGTIPFERMAWAPARMVAGCDLDPEALFSCMENSEGMKHPPDWIYSDARKIPFPDYSIDRVVTNLPFGHKHGDLDLLPDLYRRFVVEVGRILRPGGVAVFLTSKKNLLLRALGKQGPLYYEKSIRVKVLGRSAEIVKAMRK